LRQDGVLRFGKAPGDCARHFEQAFTVNRELITRRNRFLLGRRQVRAHDLVDLMPEQIDFLLACRFRRAQGGVLGAQRLQFVVT
jgi:hypothetical protein